MANETTSPSMGDDLMDTLRASVKRTAEASAHGAALARDLFEHRDDLRHALETHERIEAEDAFDLFMEEVARVYRSDPQRLTRSGFRSDLVVEWVEVLVEALEEVRAVFARADHFAEVAANQTDEDREFRTAARRLAASRWRQAS